MRIAVELMWGWGTMSTQPYKVGIEQIDREHDELFVLATSIHAKVIKGAGNDALMNDLKSYASALAKHFETEETLFPQYEYPFMAEHTQEHERLLNVFNTHVSIIAEQERGVWARELINTMDALCQHIITYDLLLNDELEKGVSARGAEKGERREPSTRRSEEDRRMALDRRIDIERRCAMLSDMRSYLESHNRRNGEVRREIQRRVLTDCRVPGDRRG